MKYTHLDAEESVFFSRQLEHFKTKAYDVKYPGLKARMMIPVSSEADSGAESITYDQFDMVGMAKIIANYANDLPRVDVKGKQFTASIKSLGASYGYNLQEIRAAAKANRNLTQRKANAALRAVKQQENNIAFFGDTAANLQGWFTNPNIPDVALATGSWITNATSNPDGVIGDMNDLANTVADQSNGVEEADTMLMPLQHFTKLRSTPRSSTTDTTIMQYFLDNNGFIKDVDWLNELDASKFSAIGNDSAIAYRRNEDAFTLEIPQDFETFAPQLKGLEWEVPVHERIGGVLIYYPLSQAITDDI